MATTIYNFPDIVKGNTFNARKITFPFSITGACIVMQFRRRAESAVVFEWKTSDNSIEILSDTEILMTTKIMDFSPYSYSYDTVITFIDGTTYTYFEGKLKINENISERCQA